MLDSAKLRNFLESRLPDALDLLRQMVGINSFTGNPEGVNRLARLTAQSFAPLGFAAEHVPSQFAGFGNHLVLTREASEDGQRALFGRPAARSIAMISHLDTVFPAEEEERNNFRWQVEGDRIFGPGTQDIKGGTVLIWLMLEALRAQAPEIFEGITWRILLNSSEEQFSPDFGDLCRDRFDAGTRCALVFESEGRERGEGLVVVARKGRASWRVTARGRAAHAGGKHPHGANAVVQIGRTVQQIAALTDYQCGLTFNVGTVTGGTVLNRVPHEAVAEGEFRAFDSAAFERGRSGLLALSGPGEVRSMADGYACVLHAEILTETRPWPRNGGTDGLYRVWKSVADELQIPLGMQERGGLSDGNLIWDLVPTIDGLGPWGDNDHCSERSPDGSKLPEYVEISSFVPKALVNTIAVERLARENG